MDVASNSNLTTLIGVSGQPGAFTADIVDAMSKNTARPVIFPLSNPTSRCEATPDDLIMWSHGRALIGTGSPFAPVQYEGRTIPIDQTNNSYIFPGLGLGIIAVGAKRVTQSMLMASAKALAELSPVITGKSERLLPPVEELRKVSSHVAVAVAKQAIIDGVAEALTDSELDTAIQSLIWEPVYKPYRLIKS